MKAPDHLAIHPFGQIPTYEEGDLTLFQTGAIAFHIAEGRAGLLPEDANARARAITRMFAALNTIEPPILDLVVARTVEGNRSWTQERLPLVVLIASAPSWNNCPLAWAIPIGSTVRSARTTC